VLFGWIWFRAPHSSAVLETWNALRGAGAGKTLPASFLFIAIAATSLLHTVERWAEKRGGIVDRLKNHQNAGHLLLGIVCGILFTLTYLKLSFTAPRSDFIYFRF
jgi:hypothetical protein